MRLNIIHQLETFTPWRTVEWHSQSLDEVTREMKARNAWSIDLHCDPDADVSWLPSIPNLLRIHSIDTLKDDQAVWDVSTLQSALLANSSRSPARVDHLPAVRSVELDWRKGLETASDHPTLERLTVWRVASKDLGWLRAGVPLWDLVLVARRSKATLDIAGADLANLKAITLEGVRAGDVSALTTATHLDGLYLNGVTLLTTTARDELLTALATIPKLQQVIMRLCTGVTQGEVREALPEHVGLTFTP